MLGSEYIVALSQYHLFCFSVSNSLHVFYTGCILWYMNVNNWQIGRSNKPGTPSSELNLCYCGEVFYTNKWHSDKIATSILKNRLTTLTGLSFLDRPTIPGAKSCAKKRLHVFEMVWTSWWNRLYSAFKLFPPMYDGLVVTVAKLSYYHMNISWGSVK